MKEAASPSRGGGHTTFEVSDRAKSICAQARQAEIALNHPMPSETLCEELLGAARNASTRNAASMKALRGAVGRFTAALKNDGAPPEAILVSIKSVVNSPVFPSIVSPSRDVNPERLRQLISTWCIEDMFRERQS